MTDTLTVPETQEVQELLRDLSKTRDFPALSQVISQVSRVASSESSHTDDLTDIILRDVSLTNKLLRIVNSAHFGHFGGQPINTISRAIVILGYDTIRDTALSLMLFEHLNNTAQAQELKGEAVESFFSGILGRTLAGQAHVRDREEVFICTLFRNMGRMMARLHFYERTKAVAELVAKEGLTEDQAARRILGVTYDEFGQALARHWHLPPALAQGMQPLPPGPIKAPTSEAGKTQILANMAHELYLRTRAAAPEDIHLAIAEVGKKYGEAIAIPAEHLAEAVYSSGKAMEKEGRLLQVDPRTSPLVKHLLEGSQASKSAGREASGDARETAGETQEVAPIEDANGILITGLQDLTAMLLDNSRLTDILHVATELLFRAHCFDNVVICAIAPGGKELRGRIGMGPQAEQIKTALHIPLSFTPDAFHAAISKGADLLIQDTEAENIRGRIPDWYQAHVGAKSFLLLPILNGGRPVGLVYGDCAHFPLQIPAPTLGLLKSVRNQINLALRQQNHH